MQTFINAYRQRVTDYYTWSRGSAVPAKVLLCILMACFTGLMAQFRFFLPWTPVPVTGQTFAVIICGIALGRWGAVSQAIYLLLGLCGVPWFAGAQAGPSAFLAPTAGYLAGFVAAAYAVGYLYDAHEGCRTFTRQIIVISAANFILIHGCGMAFLEIWLFSVKGSPAGLFQLLSMGLFPFLPGDAVKILAAASISTILRPGSAGGMREDEQGR